MVFAQVPTPSKVQAPAPLFAWPKTHRILTNVETAPPTPALTPEAIEDKAAAVSWHDVSLTSQLPTSNTEFSQLTEYAVSAYWNLSRQATKASARACRIERTWAFTQTSTHILFWILLEIRTAFIPLP
jgi:hypothetical protein